MARVLDLLFDREDTFKIVDDFAQYVTTDIWTTGGTNGTAAVGDAAGGILTISSGATADNDYGEIYTTHELFKIANSKPLGFRLKAHHVTTAAVEAGIFIGFMNAFATDPVDDDTGAIKTTKIGFGFHLKNGETEWRCAIMPTTVDAANVDELMEADNANNLAQKDITAATASDVLLEAYCDPISSTEAVFDFWVDKVHVFHKRVTYASATEMNFGMCVKSGDASHVASETILADRVAVGQLR